MQEKYHEDLDERFRIVSLNTFKFAQLEQQFKQGTITDTEIAIKTQAAFNVERRLDSDYEDDEDSQVAALQVEDLGLSHHLNDLE